MPSKLPSRKSASPQARVTRSEDMQRARLSPQMKDVLEGMAHEGLSLRAAAERAGLRYDSARRAMNRPHVKIAFNQLVKEMRENAGQIAYFRIQRMSESADSEHVRLEAAKWVAGVEHIAPVKKVEGRIAHAHGFAGFTFGQFEGRQE